MKSRSFHWNPKCEKVMPLDDSSQLPKADANIAKQGMREISALSNKNKMSNNVGNVNDGKKAGQSQNIAMEHVQNELDQNTMAALKFNKVHFSDESINLEEAKRDNERGTMLNLAGSNLSCANFDSAAILRRNPSCLGDFPLQSKIMKHHAIGKPENYNADIISKDF